MNWRDENEIRNLIISFFLSFFSNRSKQELSSVNDQEIVDINAPIGISYNPSIDINQQPEQQQEEEKDEMKSSSNKKKKRRRKRRKNNAKKSSPWIK